MANRKTTQDLLHGREVWKHLEAVMASGQSRDRVFSDWLDLMLNALLSLTDNMSRPGIEQKLKENKLNGVYEERYMEIVARYKDERPHGKRNIDHFAAAFGELQAETQKSGSDVLGEIFMSQITFGEHGQFYTPECITEVMAQISIDTQKPNPTVSDPACGSGRTLISAAKVNPSAMLYGVDLDVRCAKMCVLNMHFLNLNAVIGWGNSLTMEFWTEWRVFSGFVYERDVPTKQERKDGQQMLFAA